MGKWQIIFSDKDTGKLKVEPVDGWSGGRKRDEELKEEGHRVYGWRESLPVEGER